MKLVVGLGNPGSKYSSHRHNLGANVVRSAAAAFGVDIRKRKGYARIGVLVRGTFEVVFAVSRTYMNFSGYAVAPLVNLYEIEGEDLLIVHDDIDLEFSRIKFSFGAGAGGHNGVQSVIDELGTQDFCRLRIGVGRPPEGVDPADYVLSRFGREERCNIDKLMQLCVQAIGCYISHGIAAAQQRYN